MVGDEGEGLRVAPAVIVPTTWTVSIRVGGRNRGWLVQNTITLGVLRLRLLCERFLKLYPSSWLLLLRFFLR